MSLLLTAVFENSFCELYLPSVDNKIDPQKINRCVSGRSEAVVLPLAVKNGVWSMNPSTQYDTGSQQPVELHPGTQLSCEFRDGTNFTLNVEESNAGDTLFTQYYLDRSITIGSAADNLVCCTGRNVESEHAVIRLQNGAAIVQALHGKTFVNGHAVHGEYRLQYGDVVYLHGLKVVFMGKFVSINNPGGSCKVSQLQLVDPSAVQLAQTQSDGQRRDQLDTETISVANCPASQPAASQFGAMAPAFTMLLPMLLGALLMKGAGGFNLFGLLIVLASAAAGVLWASANLRAGKREAQENEAHRVETYQNYIAHMEEEIQQKMAHNRAVLEQRYPDVRLAADCAMQGDHHLIKNSTDKDFMQVRLGLCDLPSPNQIVVGGNSELLCYAAMTDAEEENQNDPLNRKAQELKEKLSTLKQVPASFSLAKNSLVGIVSANRDKALNLGRVLTIQLAATHAEEDVRLCCVFSEQERAQWNFAGYLPHTWSEDGKQRLLASDSASAGEVLHQLSAVVRQRTAAAQAAKAMPRYVVVMADWSLVENSPVEEYLRHPERCPGLTVITLAETVEQLPAGCTAIVRDDPEYQGFYSCSNAFAECKAVKFDRIIDQIAKVSARKNGQRTDTSRVAPVWPLSPCAVN